MSSPALVKRTVSLVNRETGKSENFTIVVGAPSPQSGRGAASEGEALYRAINDARFIFEKLVENGGVAVSGGKK